MNEYEVHETALKQVCDEIKQIIEENKKSGMNDQRLDRMDKLYHTKKDILATWGMEHPEEYYEDNSGDNMSGMRGRSPMTGRYVSRDANQTYAEGFSKGYSEAMNQMNTSRDMHQGEGTSGHYPMHNPYYPDQRRW